MQSVKLAASALAIAAVSASAAAARDNVQIAGSSTVLPYASIVAEAFGENFGFPTPVVESGGSSAGLKRFCEGVGENTIDSQVEQPGGPWWQTEERASRCHGIDLDGGGSGGEDQPSS